MCASWHPERRSDSAGLGRAPTAVEIAEEAAAYLVAVNTMRDELLRDPTWLPEPCYVEGCEHIGGTA